MPFVRFVVLTTSRTGSTWLIDLLNMQSGVKAHGELFLDRPRLTPAIADLADYPRFVELHGTPSWRRIPKVLSYLSALYQAQCTVGFKLMYSQLREHPEILVYLAARRVRVLHLVRRNHIDAIISDELANLTGASHVRAGAKIEAPKVYLNVGTLIDRVRRRSSMVARARSLIWLATCPRLEVTYEELLQGEQEFWRICNFLDILQPASSAQSSLAKRGTRSHREAIINFDEVREVLKSTPFANMLR